MQELIKLSFILFLIILLIYPLNAQRFDFSNGIGSVDVNYPCTNGATGTWTEEPATTYAGGPTEGYVFTSKDPLSASCLDTFEDIDILKQSKLHIQFYKNFINAWENFNVRLINDEGQFDWFKVTGNNEYQGWHEVSKELPRGIKPGKYKIQVWDDSIWESLVSLRYFEVSDQDLQTTTADSTSKESTVSLMYDTDTSKSTSDSPTTEFTASYTDLSDLPTDQSSLSSTSTSNLSPSASSDTSDSSLTPSETTPLTTISFTNSPTVFITTTDANEPPVTPPPNNGFVFSWWSFVIGLALGVLLMAIMFGVVTWCWWVACVRWRSKSQHSRLPETIPRLEVLSTPGSSMSITGRSTPPSYGSKPYLPYFRNK